MKKKKGATFSKHGVTVDDHDEPHTQGRKAGSYPPPASIERAGHEIKQNPPKQLDSTKKKFGKKRARKQKIAMMLNKARTEG